VAYSLTVVISGLQVNLTGYKKFEDAVEVLKCADYLDEKRIESTFYYPKSKPDTRVGIKDQSPRVIELHDSGGFSSYGERYRH